MFLTEGPPAEAEDELNGEEKPRDGPPAEEEEEDEEEERLDRDGGPPAEEEDEEILDGGRTAGGGQSRLSPHVPRLGVKDGVRRAGSLWSTNDCNVISGIGVTFPVA